MEKKLRWENNESVLCKWQDNAYVGLENVLPCKLCLEQKFPIFQEDRIKENSIFKPLGGFVSPVAV